MYKLVGKFNILILILFLIKLSPCWAGPLIFPEQDSQWATYVKSMNEKMEKEKNDGLSYVISGSLALVGGLIAERSTSDNLEKGTYSVVQTIGIASIGYGAYNWRVGDDERNFYLTLNRSNLNAEQKLNLLKVYRIQQSESGKKLNNIKAITHGLISVLNIYNAVQQDNSSIKSGLYFIGGVNLLAAIGYTFEF